MSGNSWLQIKQLKSPGIEQYKDIQVQIKVYKDHSLIPQLKPIHAPFISTSHGPFSKPKTNLRAKKSFN